MGKGRPAAMRFVADLESPMSTATPNPAAATPTVLLIAPNISEQMGGEAIKAIQIYLELQRQGVDVYQITHARVRTEIEKKYPNIKAYYLEDTAWQKFLWASRVLRPILRISFQKRAARYAERLLAKHPGAIVHVTSPVSPVQPHFPVRGAPLVLGPLNGNIFYPPAFQAREDATDRLRRLVHRPAQFLHKLFFPGNRRADKILVSGGDRSFASLRMAGCSNDRLIASIDSGIEARLEEAPRIEHRTPNFRYVHNSRLVDHKGADLVIKALAKTKNRVTLDIIGRGPKTDEWKAIAAKLNLNDRVTFIPWVEDHSKLQAMLREYRGFVFPSLAEANGIVVQEAMMMGLPVVCLDWGGPGLLVTKETGIAIEPRSEDYVTTELANAMDLLGEQPEVAERISIAARQRAIDEGFSWPAIIRRWTAMYRELAARSQK